MLTGFLGFLLLVLWDLDIPWRHAILLLNFQPHPQSVCSLELLRASQLPAVSCPFSILLALFWGSSLPLICLEKSTSEQTKGRFGLSIQASHLLAMPQGEATGAPQSTCFLIQDRRATALTPNAALQRNLNTSYKAEPKSERFRQQMLTVITINVILCSLLTSGKRSKWKEEREFSGSKNLNSMEILVPTGLAPLGWCMLTFFSASGVFKNWGLWENRLCEIISSVTELASGRKRRLEQHTSTPNAESQGCCLVVLARLNQWMTMMPAE